jgi:hypothetical protein
MPEAVKEKDGDGQEPEQIAGVGQRYRPCDETRIAQGHREEEPVSWSS